MNKKIILIVFLSVLLISGSIYASLINNNLTEENIKESLEIIEFRTDKEVYGSRENLEALVVISSLGDLKDLKIELKGISPRSHYYIDVSDEINLERGENEIILESRTPFCTTGCGGVRPGFYNLEVNVFSEEELILSSEIEIELVNN